MEIGILVIDISKCHGCNNCFMACKDEFVNNEFSNYTFSQPRHGHRWINIIKKERGIFPMVDVVYLPLLCQQCEDAPCLRGGNLKGDYESNNVVRFDLAKSIGRKDVLGKCPYKVIYWNEEKEAPQKCNQCIHLTENGWDKPRCVMACPTGAMNYVKIEEEKISAYLEVNELKVLHPEYNTKPRVFYKNLDRYLKNFIGGSLTYQNECLKDVKIFLGEDERNLIDINQNSNTFGDFKVDGLLEGTYFIKFELEGFMNKLVKVNLNNNSLYLGKIEMEKI